MKPTDESPNTKETSTDTKEMPMDSTVPISEDFQQKVMALMKTCTKAECSFVREQCMMKEDELRKKDSKDVSMKDYEDVISSEE